MFSRMSPALRRRIYFLLAGNAGLLALIYLLLEEGSSYGQVLAHIGPNTADYILAGIGLTGIIYTGAIDLSIGAVVGVAATVLGILYSHEAPPLVCFACCGAAAWLLIALNGWSIAVLGIPSIIITLAGLTIYRGLGLILADVSLDDFSGNISMQNDAYQTPGTVYAGWVVLAGIVAALVYEATSQRPRLWLARGCSETACRLKGLDPVRIQRTAFVVGGFFIGLAAIVHATRLQAIAPSRIGLGLELEIIGAIVLGGTNIFGGEGSYLGTILGALFLYLIGEAFVYAGVSPYYKEVIRGGLIIVVIGFDCYAHRRRKLMEELA